MLTNTFKQAARKSPSQPIASQNERRNFDELLPPNFTEIESERISIERTFGRPSQFSARVSSKMTNTNAGGSGDINSSSSFNNKRNSPSSANLTVQQKRKSAKGSPDKPAKPASSLQYQPVASSSPRHQQDAEQHKRTPEEKPDWIQLLEPQPIASLCKSKQAQNQIQDESKKHSHCEIEKRRRDKMNKYIVELASVIPSFTNNQSKFDKLTVLRMAVQHVKSLRSSLCSFSSFHLRPSFLSSGNLLKNLILQVASQEAQDNLFMVVTCDHGKVLFVSQSSKDILNQDQSELVGQCLFDLLHKDDVSKVKEQISYFNLMPKEMLVDSKTLQPIKCHDRQIFSRIQNQSNSTPQPGARRSFFCRMRSGRGDTCGGMINGSALKESTPLSIIPPSPSGASSSPSSNSSSSSSPPSSSSSEVGRSANQSQFSSQPARSYALEPVVTGSNLDQNSDSEGPGTSSDSSSSGITSGTQSNGQLPLNQSFQSNETDRKSRNRDGQTTTTNTMNTRSIPSSKKHLRYNVMHCTGYLKSITLRSDEIDDDDFDELNSETNNNDSEDDENDSCKTINCLVAVCRRSPMDTYLKPDRPLTFTCRYSMEGKFVFADQRTTVALGYTPQQLLGTSHYAYCHKDSVNTFKECHRQSILKSEPVSSDIYQFKRANGQYLWLQTSLKSFRNPWTKFIDYIVANHTTAEGSDPHCNEGCIPTKFNQDMNCEAFQSSSPASSSSLSLPSMDSKKSLSPGSSVGSSYSVDSFASCGSIQALLNQIDRVKSGGNRHALDIYRRKGDVHIVRSDGGSSARKSTEDNGSSSDAQSYSSSSSQLSIDFINSKQSINSYAVNQQPPSNQTSVSGLSSTSVISGDTFYNQKSTEASMRKVKASSKMPRKPSRPSGNTVIRYQRHHTNPSYHYRGHQAKSSSYSSPSSDTGNETATWSNSSGSIYSNSSGHQSIRETVELALPNQLTDAVRKDGGQPSSRVCSLPMEEQTMGKLQPQRQTAFVMQTIQNPNMTMVPDQIQMQGQMGGIGAQINQTYLNDPMTVQNSYMNQEVTDRYTGRSVNLEQMEHGLNMNTANQIQSNIAMTTQPQPPQHQSHRSQQSGNVNMTMMWNTTENAYNQNLNTMHNVGMEQQICNDGDVTLMNMDVGNSTNQMVAAQPTTVHCQQCANHKCSNQQMMNSSNTDLSGVNLTSLLMDGDLDEDHLLEYLAGCDPDAQLYNMKNNEYNQQENIYNQQS